MDPILIESGLFGRGLVAIDTPKGVAMYNEALTDLGLERTNLDHFHIDGIGWSPEIAAEKGNPSYLGHGDANRVGIIATPEQSRKPILRPTYTFKRRLMKNLFDRNMREFADCTLDACVEVQLELNISSFGGPRDLLLLESVTVEASAGKFMQAASEQTQLAAQFMAPGTAWFDTNLRNQIIASAEKYGDLRRRRTEIPKFLFSLIGNFWARSFGGVFVLLAGKDKILVVEDERLLKKVQPEEGERFVAFSLSQKRELISYLLEEDLIELDLRHYKENPEVLQNLKEFIMMDCVCRAEPDCMPNALSISKRKGILLSGKVEVPRVLSEVEHFLLSKKATKKQGVDFSEELQMLLLRPSQRAGNNAHAILRMLLLHLQDNPLDIMRLYVYDKERFFALFETWTPAKKRWAAKYVADRYRAEMDKTDK